MHGNATIIMGGRYDSYSRAGVHVQINQLLVPQHVFYGYMWLPTTCLSVYPPISQSIHDIYLSIILSIYLLAHIGVDIPPWGLTGGGSCNMSGTSAVFLSFLILARATAAITVTATSAHTTRTPPTPADTAVIRVFGSSVVGPSIVGVLVAPKADVGCGSINNVEVRVGLGLGLDAVYKGNVDD